MAYRIVFFREVWRQLTELPGHIKALAKQRIASLSDNPRPIRSNELTGHADYFRLWLGADYRHQRSKHTHVAHFDLVDFACFPSASRRRSRVACNRCWAAACHGNATAQCPKNYAPPNAP